MRRVGVVAWTVGGVLLVMAVCCHGSDDAEASGPDVALEQGPPVAAGDNTSQEESDPLAIDRVQAFDGGEPDRKNSDGAIVDEELSVSPGLAQGGSATASPVEERWDRGMVRSFISKVRSEQKAQKEASGGSDEEDSQASSTFTEEDALTYDVEFPAYQDDGDTTSVLAVTVLPLIRTLNSAMGGRVVEEVPYGTTVEELRRRMNRRREYNVEPSMLCDYVYRREPEDFNDPPQTFSREPLGNDVRITTAAQVVCLSKRAKTAADIISTEAKEPMANVLRWLATGAPPPSAFPALMPFESIDTAEHSIFNALLVGVAYGQVADFEGTSAEEELLGNCPMPFLTAKMKAYFRRVFYIQTGTQEKDFESWTEDKKTQWTEDRAKYAYTGTVCEIDSDCNPEEFCFPTVELLQPQRCSRLPLVNAQALYIGNGQVASWHHGKALEVLRGLHEYMSDPSSASVERAWNMTLLYDKKNIDCTHAGEVQNQGTCATCWSFAASTAISISTCVASNGAFNGFVSPGSLVARAHNLDLDAGSEAMLLSPKVSTSGALESYHVDALWGIVQGFGDRGVLPEACRPTRCLQKNGKRFMTMKDSIHAFASTNLRRLEDEDPAEREKLVAKETLNRLRINAAVGKARGATLEDEDKLKKALKERTDSMVLATLRSKDQCQYVPRILLKDFTQGTQVLDMVMEYGKGVHTIYDYLRNQGPIVLSIPTKLLEEKTQRSQPKNRVYGVRRYYQYMDYDHSVVLVGWGETDFGEKYWLIQNSWGKGWEDEGYFRVQRGFSLECIEKAIEYYDVAGARQKDSVQSQTLADCTADFLFAHYDMLIYAGDDVMFTQPVDETTWAFDTIRTHADTLQVQPCLNGGVMDAEMACICPVKFKGDRCEMCNTKHPSCAYGAWNSDTCQCDCPKGRFGPNCNTKVEVVMCAGPAGEREARITQDSQDSFDENEFVQKNGKPLVVLITLYDSEGQIVGKKPGFGGYTQTLAEAIRLSAAGEPFATLDGGSSGVAQAMVDVPSGTNEFGKLLYAKHEVPVLDGQEGESEHCP